jgi:hypothetical protein
MSLGEIKGAPALILTHHPRTTSFAKGLSDDIADMCYDEIDTLAINTIRILAVCLSELS